MAPVFAGQHDAPGVVPDFGDEVVLVTHRFAPRPTFSNPGSDMQSLKTLVC